MNRFTSTSALGGALFWLILSTASSSLGASNKTFISYNEPAWLAIRHQISNVEALISKMEAGIAELVAKAAKV